MTSRILTAARERFKAGIASGRGALAVSMLATAGCSGSAALPSGIVVSGSMEPTFAGPRFDYECHSCGRSSFWAADPPADASEGSGFSGSPSVAISPCPACGHAVTPTEYTTGGRYRLRPIPAGETPRIGEVVAFEFPDSSDLQVKRVVGLPGQRVRLLAGDLWIDSRRHECSLPHFLSRSIELDTAEYAGDASAAAAAPGWVVYRPSSLYPRSGPELARHAAPVWDEEWWNPRESRELAPVGDIALLWSFDSAQPQSELEFRLLHHRGIISGHIDIGEAAIAGEVRLPDGESIGLHLAHHGGPICAAIADGQLLIGEASGGGEWRAWRLASRELTAVDAVLEAAVPFTSSDVPAPPDGTGGFGFVIRSDAHPPELSWFVPAAYRVQAAGGHRVSLRRDLYYRGPRGELDYELPGGEGLAVLGDSSAASLDSRQSDARVPLEDVRAYVGPQIGEFNQ